MWGPGRAAGPVPRVAEPVLIEPIANEVRESAWLGAQAATPVSIGWINAIERGLVDAEAHLSDREVFDLIFFAGFAIVGAAATPAVITWLENWAGEITNIALVLFVVITLAL